MILINNLADYSDCGIGKAPIITNETKELLKGYSELHTEKAFAFQDFMFSIGGTDGAIWTALDKLYLPMFGADLKEAFFDVKNGVTAYSGGNGVITDENIGTYWIKTSKGVRIGNTEVAGDLYYYYSNGARIAKADNNMVYFAVSEPMAEQSKEVMIGGEIGTSSSSKLKLNLFGGSISNVDNPNINTPNSTDLFFFSNRDVNNGYLRCMNKEREIETEMQEPTATLSPLFGGGGYPWASTIWPVGLKIMGFGNGLSLANAKAFVAAINAFNNAVNEIDTNISI